MWKILEAIKNSAWVRLGMLVALIVILIWTFGLSPRERQSIELAMAAKLGMIAPALILGAAWGWIRFSRAQWGWATAVLLVGTIAAAYWGGPLNENYKALDAPDELGLRPPAPARPDYSGTYYGMGKAN